LFQRPDGFATTEWRASGWEHIMLGSARPQDNQVFVQVQQVTPLSTEAILSQRFAFCWTRFMA
jgi:hypothetical protein